MILLYAARRPVIVHDAYTARLCRRLGLGPERDGYDDWRAWLDERLPDDLDFRRRSPRRDRHPLQRDLPRQAEVRRLPAARRLQLQHA